MKKLVLQVFSKGRSFFCETSKVFRQNCDFEGWERWRNRQTDTHALTVWEVARTGVTKNGKFSHFDKIIWLSHTVIKYPDKKTQIISVTRKYVRFSRTE